MTGKPFAHYIEAAWMRCNELLDLFLGQMFAVALVEWVADLCYLPFQFREAWLGQRNAQLDDVRRWGAAQTDPVAGGRDTLAELEMAGSSGGEGYQEERQEERER